MMNTLTGIATALLCGPAALFLPATSARLDASGGNLLKCGNLTRKDYAPDSRQMLENFAFAKTVCCGQLGESCVAAQPLPQSCLSATCARAVRLVADSCAGLLAADYFQVFAQVYLPLLDHSVALCEPKQPLHRFAITAPSSTNMTGAATGATLTDGMGAGGHNSSVSGFDDGTLQAAPGKVAALVLQSLHISPADYVEVFLNGAMAGVTFRGTDLKIYPEAQRTFRSKPGGKIRVQAYSDLLERGQAIFFSFRVPCGDDAGCGGHGTCDKTKGMCRCQSGWIGPACGAPSVSPGFGGVDTHITGATTSGTTFIENALPAQVQKKQWALCYDSRTDCTNHPSCFHSKCDAHAETLVLGHNSIGYTFGGFAQASWEGS